MAQCSIKSLSYKALRIEDIPKGLQPREMLNHPSGDPTQSDGDIAITQILVEARRLMNVPVLDHLIIGTPSAEHSGFFSIAASGPVDF